MALGVVRDSVSKSVMGLQGERVGHEGLHHEGVGVITPVSGQCHGSLRPSMRV